MRIADRIKESCPEKERIIAIETERTEGKRQRRAEPRHSSPSAIMSRHRRSSSKDRPQNSGLCYYHDAFRDRARKCRALCNWTRHDGQGIKDLFPRRHRCRYKRIPAQQTTRSREQRYIRAVRGQSSGRSKPKTPFANRNAPFLTPRC